MQKNLVKSALLVTFALTLLPTMSQAQEDWVVDSNGTGISYGSVNYPYGDAYGYNIDPMNGYSSIDYDYNNPYYYSHRDRGYREFNGYVRFGRRFDNSDNFTSGISSYQGTSTGPGPNGGYPGSPRGIYPTNYYDTRLYPNTYMRIYPY